MRGSRAAYNLLKTSRDTTHCTLHPAPDDRSGDDTAFAELRAKSLWTLYRYQGYILLLALRRPDFAYTIIISINNNII